MTIKTTKKRRTQTDQDTRSFLERLYQAYKNADDYFHETTPTIAERIDQKYEAVKSRINESFYRPTRWKDDTVGIWLLYRDGRHFARVCPILDYDIGRDLKTAYDISFEGSQITEALKPIVALGRLEADNQSGYRFRIHVINDHWRLTVNGPQGEAVYTSGRMTTYQLNEQLGCFSATQLLFKQRLEQNIELDADTNRIILQVLKAHTLMAGTQAHIELDHLSSTTTAKLFKYYEGAITHAESPEQFEIQLADLRVKFSTKKNK